MSIRCDGVKLKPELPRRALAKISASTVGRTVPMLAISGGNAHVLGNLFSKPTRISMIGRLS